MTPGNPINQKILDTVMRRMRKQRAPAWDPVDGGTCVNVDSHGNRCAISLVFWPQFAKRTENHVLAGKLERGGADYAFVQGLRDTHDQSAVRHKRCSRNFMEEFETRALELATRFGLTFPAAPRGQP